MAMVARIEAYRVRAAECEAIAAASTDIKTRMIFAQLAAQWRLLAEKVETLNYEQSARA
jgi:hypothetical protein